MTAPLKWRSQYCPCGFCPDGTRIEWRYRLDIRFRPRGRTPVSGARSFRELGKDLRRQELEGRRKRNVEQTET